METHSQRIRVLGTFNLNGMTLSNSLPEGSGNPEQRAWRIPRHQAHLNQNDQSSFELTETEATCMGLHGSAPNLLCVYHGFQLTAF